MNDISGAACTTHADHLTVVCAAPQVKQEVEK